DAANNQQWQRSFGGSDLEQLSAIHQTSDQGYILGGFSSSGISGTKTNSGFGGFDYWIIKIDSSGNRQWEKTFGGTGGDLLFDVRQTSDGGFILGGQSASGTNGNKAVAGFGDFDYWIIKLNSSGVKQWEQV